MLTSKVRRAENYETEDGKRPFEEWLKGLKDTVAQAKLAARVRRAENGNFGTYRDLRDGLFELKDKYGPGYRVYFALASDAIILLLIGGHKRSQDGDIARARRYWEDYKRR